VATMSGFVTSANPDPGPGGITVGSPLVFQVIDNGQGAAVRAPSFAFRESSFNP
jgi:hypothetical protein